ncbi:MAG TPA: adenylate/guanylate cyclase domain-containing protein, partial [Gemmatimonadota bacterium]|nr:adenylate/guanylate cyclase domain-containing protein [Gemmatimonadota bacterium]
GVHIAYQVIGEGPLDLVFVSGWISHVELYWEIPEIADFFRRLASFSRLIVFDKRGTGMSDRVSSSELPTLEQRMDDVRAVMDAVGSERAVLMGLSEGGPMNLLFAATYPDRTRALVLMSTYARMLEGPDYPFGTPPAVFDDLLGRIVDGWGAGIGFHTLMPSMGSTPGWLETWSRFQRLSASPGAAVDLLRMAADVDARAILPAITVPTLVLHRAGDRWVSVEKGRYLAQHIAGARYVEFPGNDHLPFFGDSDRVVSEIQEFLTGAREGPDYDRVLATILFVDIVGSTEHAASIGDRRWREVLASFYVIARREFQRFRGRELDTAGDGIFASFDGPARGIRCAAAIERGVRQIGIDVRCGLHTGECEVIGEKLSGIAVHAGARIASQARPRQVLVSQTVKDLVAGSGLQFQPAGTHALKGIPGEWPLYSVS